MIEPESFMSTLLLTHRRIAAEAIAPSPSTVSCSTLMYSE